MFDKQKGNVEEFLRVLHYLGLLGDLVEVGVGDTFSINDALRKRVYLTQSPPPYPFNKNVIFIAIDFEAWEKAPRPVTEIGIAILDTRDIHSVAPGKDNAAWFKQIRAKHFLVQEHVDKINHQYVTGCPDRFDFGKSEYVKEVDIASKLEQCLHEALTVKVEEGNEVRNVVLVFHGASSDLQYCESIGFFVPKHQAVVDIIDTASINIACTGQSQPASLSKMLHAYDITPWNLHNAGNDAVYTLQVMLSICIRTAALPPFEEGSCEPAKLLALEEAAIATDEDDGDWEL